MPRIKCLNDGCKFNIKGKCAQKEIKVNREGICNNFSPNFTYYFNLGLEVMKDSIIFEWKLSPEERLGLYYVMEVYHLHFINFRDALFIGSKDSNKSVTIYDLDENDFDYEKCENLIKDFNNGILPEGYLKLISNKNKSENENKKESKYEVKDNIPKVEYGFISPAGKFFPGDFATHSEVANKIISKNKWEREFYGSPFNSSSDFLCYKKNYILLHNPRNPLADSINNVIVTGELEYATQHQADFLFDYFNKRKAPELALKYYQMCKREN